MPSRRQGDVVVIGGGAVGLSCAYALAHEGATVTVIERGVCGGGASLGNAGWITPALVAPLPAPGVWGEAARWAAGRSGSLSIKLRPNAELARWLIEFAWRSRRSTFESGTRAMMRLGAGSVASFDELRQDGLEFEMHESGMTFIALSENQLAKYRALLRELSKLGYSGDITELSSVEAQKSEPALTKRVAGALHASGERHVRPESFIQSLREACLGLRVPLREHTTASLLPTADGRVLVCTDHEQVTGDAVVVAAGAWSQPLLAQAGVRVPVAPARGYSLTLDTRERLLQRPLYLTEARLGISPFDGATRAAGTLEITAIDAPANPGQAHAMNTAVRRYLRHWPSPTTTTAWSGFRPLAPDGLPIIGRLSAYKNLFVATGHGMVGITLAPVTGRRIARLIVAGEGSEELSPFSPDRFR